MHVSLGITVIVLFFVILIFGDPDAGNDGRGF